MKKAQVTLFVIIGLVILVIAGLVIMIPEDNVPTSLQAQQDAALITSTVQQCLAQVGEDSIRVIMQQGGYKELNKLKDLGPNKDSEVASLPLQKIPLWQEVHTCQENQFGCLGVHHPSLCEGRACPVTDAPGDEEVSIQEGIQTHIQENIDACLNGFVSTPTIQVKISGEPKVQAVIAEQEVLLRLSYDMTLTTQDNQQVDLKAFSTELLVQLPMMYRLARKIQQEEQNNPFIEEGFMHLLSAYWGIHRELPPPRDLQFKGSPNHWVRSDVQKTIEENILPFMDFIQIVNAIDGYAPIVVKTANGSLDYYSTGLYEYLSVKLDTNETYPLAVKFEYPRTPMYLNINNKELLKPRTMPNFGGILSTIGIDIWDYRFHYTASFPLLVHITDHNAFNGRGLTMSYGLEANIWKNNPINLTAEEDVTIAYGQSSLDLAKESQLVNHNHKIKIKNMNDNRALANVTLTYNCGIEYEIGETNANGEWIGKLPFCMFGGVLYAQKEGYLRTGVERNNHKDDGVTDGGNNAAYIGMWPVRKKTIRIYKLTAADAGNITAGASRNNYRHNLSQNDSALVNIQRVKTSAYDDDAPQISSLQFGSSDVQIQAQVSIEDALAEIEKAYRDGKIPKDQYEQLIGLVAEEEAQREPSGASLNKTIIHTVEIDLVPGEYDLQGILLYNGLLQIPKHEDKVGSWPNEQTIKYDARNFSTWASGGIKLEKIKFNPADIYGTNNITIYVLEQPIPHTWPELQKHQTIEEYQKYRRANAAKPEFS